MVVRTSTPAIETGYRGIDAGVVNNSGLGALVLPGKGGDILGFRDRRREMDAPCRADHDWEPPGNRGVPADASEAIELTPTTAYPLGGLLEAQRANRTQKTLAPGETIGAGFTARTHGGVDAVSPTEGIAAGGG